MDTDSKTLEHRLDQLQKSHHRLQLASMAALLGIVVLALTGANRSAKDRVIEAEQFRLLDKDGTTRALMLTNEDRSVSFSLMDEHGKEVLVLGVAASGKPAALRILDPGGVERLFTGISHDGVVGLSLKDRDMRDRASLYIKPDGTTAFRISDHKNADNNRIYLGVAPSGRSQQILLDRDGKVGIGMYVDEDRSVTLGLFDKKEGECFQLSNIPGSGTVIGMRDEDGGDRISMGVLKDGSAGIDIIKTGKDGVLSLGISPQNSASIKSSDKNGKILFK